MTPEQFKDLVIFLTTGAGGAAILHFGKPIYKLLREKMAGDQQVRLKEIEAEAGDKENMWAHIADLQQQVRRLLDDIRELNARLANKDAEFAERCAHCPELIQARAENATLRDRLRQFTPRTLTTIVSPEERDGG